MSDKQLQTLAEQIVRALRPQIEIALAMRQRPTDERSRPLTRRDLQIFIRRGFTHQPNGGGDDVNFL